MELSLELFRGALGDDAPLVHDRHLVGETVGLLQVVGGEQDGEALVPGQVSYLPPHVCAGFRVEPGGRLVQEEHLGAVHQPMATSSLRCIPPE